MIKKIGEVAKLIKVTPQTVKNYTTAFPDYFSEESKSEKGKRFNYQDYFYLSQIKELRDNGKSIDDIKHVLPTVEPPLEEPEEDPEEEQTKEVVTASDAEVMRDFIDKIEQGYLNQLSTKDKFIDHLIDENKDLKEELAKKNKPWWKR